MGAVDEPDERAAAVPDVNNGNRRVIEIAQGRLVGIKPSEEGDHPSDDIAVGNDENLLAGVMVAANGMNELRHNQLLVDRIRMAFDRCPGHANAGVIAGYLAQLPEHGRWGVRMVAQYGSGRLLGAQQVGCIDVVVCLGCEPARYATGLSVAARGQSGPG